ncbi:MAG: hypothetical protein CL920_18380 [Deltaproteobacteria bacterium]|nr:hypothetical protein [Deltaproteobacteria bacterium]
MGIQAWFPTMIYCEELQQDGATERNQELIEECYQIEQVDEEGRAWSEANYVGGFTSHASMSELHKMSPTFGALEELIREHVHIYAEELDLELGGGELVMSNCWINIMPPHCSHAMHIHPLSVISGTYYVQTPNNCAPIQFEDPRYDRFMAAPPKKDNARQRSLQLAKYHPKAGQVVLFESWLRHGIPEAETEDDRISISFNYDWV